MEEDFLNYLEKARTKMSNTAWKYDVRNHLELRTEIDNFLIAFDNVVEQYKRKETVNCECHYEMLSDGSLILIKTCYVCKSSVKNA